MDLRQLMASRRDEMVVSIKTGLGDVTINLYDELSIDEADLDTEFIALPGQIAYWTSLASQYEQLYTTLERQFDDWFGQKYLDCISSFETQAGKRPTISLAEYMTKQLNREEYLAKQSELSQARSDLARIKGVVSALQAKLQCLIQIAKRRTLEIESVEPGILEARPTSDIGFKEAEQVLKKYIGRKEK